MKLFNFFSLLMFLEVALSTSALGMSATSAPGMVITADRLLDVKTGELHTPGMVVVEGETIKAVNPLNMPSGLRQVALGDVTLLPGLIDLHTHLTAEMTPGWIHAAATHTAAGDAIRGVINARKTLHSGFTSVRDLGAAGFADIALMQAIDRDLIEGPDMFPAAHAIGATGGHCDKTGFVPGVLETGPEQGVADGAAAILRATRYQIKHGAKVIKICATGGVLSRGSSVGAQQLTAEEIEIVVDEARRQGLTVAAHAHGAAGILAAVESGVSSIEHGTILNAKIANAMREKGTYLVPTVYLLEIFDLSLLPDDMQRKGHIVGREAAAGLSLAINKGVPIAYGTDAGVIPHGDNAKQFAVLVDYGLRPIEAVRAATLYAAELLGVEDRGRLAPGRKADIVGVAGNPLENISAMEDTRFVMKSGKIYRMDSSEERKPGNKR